MFAIRRSHIRALLALGVLAVAGCAPALAANYVVVVRPEAAEVDSGGLPVSVLRDQEALDSLYRQSGAMVGAFPAVVDLDTGQWRAIGGEGAAAALAALEQLRQLSKPSEQLALENSFFTLAESVLVAAGDPRAGSGETPKLGFAELTALIRTVQAVDPLAAMSLTLELLSVDAALKRYDLGWWDRAERTPAE